ncbi:MAG: SIMPL domain-containing protein [Alphaproteobacteria bacterium]
MKNVQGILIALIGAFGLVISGHLISRSLQRFGGNNNQVTVRGIGERDVKANYGSWQIEFLVRESNLEKAMKSFKKTNQVIQEFLKEQGFNPKEISLGVPNVRFGREDKFGLENREENRHVNVEGVVYVVSEDVEKIQAAFVQMSRLFERGVILNGWNQFPVYSIKNFDTLRPELLEEATKSAQMVAEKFASAGNVKLGRVKNLNQGAFSINSKEEGSAENMGSGQKPSSYNKVVRVVVHVTYSIN